MGEPTLVAECVSAMRAVTKVPVTVKCRIGIEPSRVADDYEFLRGFIERVAQSGCDVFVVHARRAVLNGLSPKENREIPPLRYDVAAQLRNDFPKLTFVVNGGIRTVDAVVGHLQQFDGVMLGREAYHNPYILAHLHQAVIDPDWSLPPREVIVEQYAEYCRARLAEGHRLRTMVRHAQGLYAGLPNVRAWRRFLSEQSGQEAANADVMLQALRLVRQVA
jgi:tRNA-dihydrouridine synthase A